MWLQRMSNLATTNRYIEANRSFIQESLRTTTLQDFEGWHALLRQNHGTYIQSWFRTAWLLHIAEQQFPDAFQQAIGEDMFSFSQQETSRRLLVMRHYPLQYTPLGDDPIFASISPSYYETARAYGLHTQPVETSIELLYRAIDENLSRDEFRQICKERATELGLTTLSTQAKTLRLDTTLPPSELAYQLRDALGKDRAESLANHLIKVISPLDG